MIRLNSYQLSNSADCQKEDMTLTHEGYPVTAWVADGTLTVKLSRSGVWYPEESLSASPDGEVRIAVSGENYLVFYVESNVLKCIEYSYQNAYFYKPVIVAENVDFFAVTENSSSLKVVYSQAEKIYLKTRDDDSRVWGTGSEIVSAATNITSLSIDFQGERTVVAYTTDFSVAVYQDPEDVPCVAPSFSGTPDSIVVRMSDEENYDIIYNVESLGNRSIEHIGREGETFWTSQIVDATLDNYNIDLFVADEKAYVVWVEGGYVRYRERNEHVWSDLEVGTYIAACDSNSFPKVVFFSSYARVLLKESDDIFYAGMTPMEQQVTATFNCAVWGDTKSIQNENSSISSLLVKNALCQRIKFNQQSLSIGGVSCYFKKYSNESSVSFDIVMDIYYSDILGKPYATPIASSTISSALITSDGWYKFSFTLDNMLCPIDGYCFVVYQDGGDEENYASWCYYVSGSSDAWISSDRITWVKVDGITRSLRVLGSFDAYEKIINDDPSQITHQLVSPPAIESIGNRIEKADLESGEFQNTELVDVREPTYYDPPVDQDARIYGYSGLSTDWRVILKARNLLLGFVIDSSGSMGWTDIFDLRESVTRSLISKLRERTEANVLFDFVKFGGVLIDDLTVNLTKRVRGVTVNIEDASSIYGYDDAGNPISSTSDPREHFASGVVAFGYKGLKTGTTYKIRGMSLGWSEFNHSSLEPNWHSFWASGSPSIFVDDTGPEEANVINVTVSDAAKNSVRYYAAYYSTMSRVRLSENVASGSYDLVLTDSSSFSAGTRFNVVSSSSFNNYFLVNSVDAGTDTVTSNLSTNYEFLSADTTVETVRSQFIKTNWEKTNAIEFYVVDENELGSIVFFVQTKDGATIEYTFTPMVEWDLSNLYFLDETATFQVDAVNSLGENMPDGTMIEYYVNKAPEGYSEDTDADAQVSYLLTQDALTGTSVLYLSATDIVNFSREDKIELTDDTKSYFISSGSGAVLYTYVVEVNLENNFLVVSDVLSDDFLISNQARIVVPATEQGKIKYSLKSALNITANVVNVTPIYTGRKLDDSLFGVLDTPQVEVSEEYDDHNFDIQRVRKNSIDVLTTDGYSAVRLLPVTEDHFVSSEFKSALSKSLFNLSAKEQADLLQKKKARGEISESSSNESSSTAAVEEAKIYYQEPLDFLMNHVSYVSGGVSSTNMKSFAWDLVSTDVDDKKYLLKSYDIYPVVSFFKTDGSLMAQVMVEPFEVLFASPYSIETEVDQTTTFICETRYAGETVIEEYVVCGDYAASGNEITIQYNLKRKGFPVNYGNIEIYIYDARRDSNSANVLDEDLGDVSGCGDSYSGSGGEQTYNGVDPEGQSEYLASISDKILADNYLSSYGIETRQTLSVVNGVATLTLPSLNKVAQLQIHARYKVDDKSEVVNIQNVYYRSPLKITYTGPLSIVADGVTTYNLSAYFSWMNVEAVPDGTIANFETSGGDLNPSISETVNGSASGVIYLPDSQPLSSEEGEEYDFEQDIAERLSGEKKKVTKTVYISGSYNGFFNKISAKLNVEEESDVADFYYICRPYPSSFFADGIDYTVMVADLQESWNRSFPFIDELRPDLIESSAGVTFSGSNLKSEGKLARWSETEPPEGLFAPAEDSPGYAWGRMTSNKFLGRPKFHPPPKNDDGPPPCDLPECVEVSSYTRSQKYAVLGTGIDSYTTSFIASTLGGVEKIPKPRVNLKEPLGVDLSFEPVDRSEYSSVEWRKTPDGSHPSTYAIDIYSHPLKRDGESQYYVVAEVTWKDSFVFPDLENPTIPIVKFKSGKLTITQNLETYSYSFKEDDDFRLEAEEAKVSISRTSFDEDHFHECFVDSNGVGKTTATITYDKTAVISDHIHTIDVKSENPVSSESFSKVLVNESGETVTVIVNHIHKPRSVAIILSGPVTDTALNISVQGIVSYDDGKKLQDGSRIVRSLDNYAVAWPSKELAEEIGIFEEQYFLEIIPPYTKIGEEILPSFLTANSKEDSGQLIVYHAWKTDSDGNELPLPDGTRIFTTFKFFKPEEQEQIESNEVLIIQQEKFRDYAVMEINARLSGLPVDVVSTEQVLIRSNKNWFPYVNNPVSDDPVNDDVYINSFLSSLGEFGGSQINDALIMMANRMIQTGTAYDDWYKAIVLLSDGSENMSENSHEQATDSVNSVSVNGCPVFAVKLFDTDSFDNVIMQKYAENTDGENFKVGQVIGDVESTSEAVANKILSSDKFGILTGSYSNVIDLGETKMHKGLRFGINMKPGTTLKFNVRFSDDGINYGTSTEFASKTYSEESGTDLQWYVVDFSAISSYARYMKYEVVFKGSISSFESPQLAGVRYEYYEPGRYVMFLQPIEIEEPESFVGEVLFAHEGTVPSTSSIRYGITHDYSNDYDVYFSKNQPLFQNGVSGIVLSRFNEPTTTVDYRNYVAVNDGWNEAYEVSVYRINSEKQRGVLVPIEDYVVDYKTGTITFSSIQPMSDKINLVITMKPYFRVFVEMKNYGHESIVLDNMSFIYNLSDKRKIADADDHRDVTSLVKTDHSMYAFVSSGTLAEDASVDVTSGGSDTDASIDCEFFQGKIFYLCHNGTSPYVAVFENNLTYLQNINFSNSPEFVPTSFSYDEGFWYLVERSATGCIIHKYDESLVFVSKSSYVVDFLQTDSIFSAVRRNSGKWYVLESDRIHVLNSAFVLEKTALIPSDSNGSFYVGAENIYVVSKIGDLLWTLGKDGKVNGYYDFLNNQNINNISYLDGIFYSVNSKKMSRLINQ